MPIPIESSRRGERAGPADGPERWTRSWGSVLLVLLLVFGGLSGPTGCRSAPGAPEPQAAPPVALDQRVTPPFYRVEGRGGARLTLLGTIHLGPADGWAYSDEVVEALEQANRLVMELDLREATEEAVSTQLANRVILDSTQTLADVVSPETTQLLDENDALLREFGMGPQTRSRMKPWYIAMVLVESIYGRSGYSNETGVESFLLASLDGRPLTGLETLDEQMAMLDELPPPLQDLMLQDTLARLGEATADVETLCTAWRIDDEDVLASIAREGVEERPDLAAFYDRLLGDRNRRWVDRLRPFLDAPEHADESVFVGVGALHLVGKDGLVSLLREAGYRVEPIAQTANP
jgi:hypothetical protein